MDELNHAQLAGSQQASAPYNAAATRGEIAMSSPITLIEAITRRWPGSWNTTPRCWCWART